MMRLILSLTLIWTLSSTAEALKCWVGQGTDIKQLPCNSAELCATVAYQSIQRYVNERLSQDTTRLCLPSSLFSEGKHKFSYSISSLTMAASVHVCNTNGCNTQAMPYPGVLKKNNLLCFTCDDRNLSLCNKTLQCVGTENRCFSGTVKNTYDETYPIFGCVTANLWKVASHLELVPGSVIKFLGEPKFCGSSFCNSAWSVKLNVIPLLFGLITFIIY